MGHDIPATNKAKTNKRVQEEAAERDTVETKRSRPTSPAQSALVTRTKTKVSPKPNARHQSELLRIYGERLVQVYIHGIRRPDRTLVEQVIKADNPIVESLIAKKFDSSIRCTLRTRLKFA
jgi:hypothetical protein